MWKRFLSWSLPGRLSFRSLTAPQGNGGGAGPPPRQAPFLLENRTRSWPGTEEGCGVSSSGSTLEEDSQMDGWRGKSGSEAPVAAGGGDEQQKGQGQVTLPSQG